MSNVTILSGIVALIGTLAGLLTWYVNRRDKQKDPIPKTAAELALAEQALGVIVASRDAMQQDVANLRAERDQDRTRIDRLEGEVVTLRDEATSLHALVDQIRSRLSDAAGYIETLLRWAHQLHNAAPPPRLPSALRDYIDPSLHGDDN